MVILFPESPMLFHNDSWLTSRNCSIRFSSKSSSMKRVTWVPVNFLSVGMDSRRAGLQDEIQVIKSDGAGIFLADWNYFVFRKNIFKSSLFSRFFLPTLKTVNSLFMYVLNFMIHFKKYTFMIFIDQISFSDEQIITSWS